MIKKINKVTKKAPKVLKVEIQEKIVDSTPEPDKFKKTPELEKQAKVEKKEAKGAKKVATPKVEKASKKRSEVLETEIRELEAKIKDKKDEIAKEIPTPVTLKAETEGFKEPSLTTNYSVHTKAEMKRIVEAYKISNPVKAARKRSELERKIRKAR